MFLSLPFMLLQFTGKYAFIYTLYMYTLYITTNIEAQAKAQAAKQAIIKAMNDERVKGFGNVLIANNVADGLSYYIQTAGLGK